MPTSEVQRLQPRKSNGTGQAVGAGVASANGNTPNANIKHAHRIFLESSSMQDALAMVLRERVDQCDDADEGRVGIVYLRRYL